ncbi:hypothetical protein [Piscinibacter sp. XHJ-5]|uniref:hypothetical protein n=1 Tax=Piscinibacter sp. XHJ-5 TaxID=3037797 RepID=UPI002452C7B4|nr:hypothetical protein [Piscinibacter sp. XHJ-5]
MWKVTAQGAEGKPYEVATSPLDDDGQAPRPAEMGDIESPTYRLLMQEAALPDAQRFMPIHQWAATAEEAAKEMEWTGLPVLKAADGGIARHAGDGQNRPSCLAWHDRGAMLISVADDKVQLSVEYIPERAEEQRMKRMLHRHASSGHQLETLLEWRAFVGRRTGIVDGWTLMRQSGRGYTASLVGATGFVVARALRRITLPEPALTSDSRMQSRLAELEAAQPAIADTCPRLEEVEPPLDGDIAMVFVHGTASCGITGLKDLFPPATTGFMVPCPVLRFEHDTFVPIIDNVKTLAAEIAHRLHVRKLLLVAHSRGGLVAADAAKVLRDAGYAGDVTVYTFGTPYQGTPLVAMGKKALNLLMKLGEGIADNVPVPVLSPLAKAMFYVMESPTLPPGILAMQEGAEALRYIQRSAEAVRLLSWGSDYDILSGIAGYGVASEGFLLGALQRPHDLVVTAQSATGCGRTQPKLECAHGQYFKQPQVQLAINNYLQPPAPRGGGGTDRRRDADDETGAAATRTAARHAANTQRPRVPKPPPDKFGPKRAGDDGEAGPSVRP